MLDFQLKKLLLLGGNRKNEDGPLLKFAHNAAKFIDEVIIFTDEHHLKLATQNGMSLLQKLEENTTESMRFITTNKINIQLLEEYVDENTLGLLINASWIVKQDVIDLFKGKLFNYHNTRLPQERGAAAYSWKILSQCREGALTIHKVVPILDAGDIIKQKKLVFPVECRVPADFYKHIETYETDFLIDFLQGKGLVCIQQNESDSLYMPKLHTLANGFINWGWSVKEIELFVNAFDDPHEGASTFFQEKRLHLKKCFLVDNSEDFHPFQSGIIYRKKPGSLFIAAKGGGLEIREIFDSNGKNVLPEIKLGHRLQTPHHFLDEARMVKPALSSRKP